MFPGEFVFVIWLLVVDVDTGKTLYETDHRQHVFHSYSECFKTLVPIARETTRYWREKKNFPNASTNISCKKVGRGNPA